MFFHHIFHNILYYLYFILYFIMFCKHCTLKYLIVSVHLSQATMVHAKKQINTKHFACKEIVNGKKKIYYSLHTTTKQGSSGSGHCKPSTANHPMASMNATSIVSHPMAGMDVVLVPCRCVVLTGWLNEATSIL